MYTYIYIMYGYIYIYICVYTHILRVIIFIIYCSGNRNIKELLNKSFEARRRKFCNSTRGVQPSESIASLSIMGEQLRALLKPLEHHYGT